MPSGPNPSKPTDPEVDSRRDYARELSMDPEVHELVRKKAGRLARVFWLDAHEREDLLQELWLELLRALDRFDESVGSLIEFAHGVANLWYLTKTRALRRAGRRPHVGNLFDGDTIVESREPPPGYTLGVRAEAAEVLASLPKELAEIAIAVTRDCSSVVAKREGVHRGTVGRRLERARGIAEEAGLGSQERKSDRARDTSLGPAEGSG